MRKEKILTINDDPGILEVLNLALSEFYEVFQASNGKEGLDLLKSKTPNLIICDYIMPVINGKEFCKTLKKDSLLQHIPTIMLTKKGEERDMVSGIEAGADDYIVKPFELNALLARVQMILRRTIRSLDANALTHLPGNTSIMEEIQRCIDGKKTFAVGYADLDKFKVYNDKYGFEKGDEVIRETARFLIKIVRGQAGPDAFIGHIGGDDFVFITDDAIMDKVCRKVIAEFDKLASQFYNKDDKKSGYIVGKDRLGNKIKTGLLSISIGIVSNATQEITHVAQVGERGAELKKYAKSFQQSKFVRDQRRD